MAKQLVVDALVARTSGELIRTPARRVLRDTVLIREFEGMLDSRKRTGSYDDALGVATSPGIYGDELSPIGGRDL